MNHARSLVLAALVALLPMGGCASHGDHDHPKKTEPKTSAQPKETASSQILVAGCGGCIFDMKGVDSCALAVKVEGKAYLVTGAQVNAHASGLCSEGKQAVVEGKVKGDRFVATRFELKKGGTWTCPMHPKVRATKAGKCPTCKMDLVPSKGP